MPENQGSNTGAIAIGLGTAIGGLIQSSQNRKSQFRENERNRAQQEEMYHWQKQDARDDWDRQNAYNSPTQQMERLRQAGLSPHLVYGKGADTTAQSVRSYSGDAPNQQAPQVDYSSVGKGLGQAYEMRYMQAQTDNVTADTALKEKEQAVKDATIASTLQSTALSQFQLKQAERAKELVYQRLGLENTKFETEIGKIKADTKFTTNQNTRAAVDQMQRILTAEMDRAKTSKEIEKIGREIELLQKETTVKEIEVELRKKGLTPNSALWQIELGNMLDKIKKGLGIWNYKK